MNTDPLEAVFKNLDRWRHLPSYQLERRADVFFSVYLRGLVEGITGVALEDTLLPELPIKCDLIWPERPSNKSVKVDYALFAKDRSRVFFVELKTDGGSRRDRQDDYLEIAQRIGFRAIASGIKDVLLQTSAHQKYHHLTATLAALGYLKVPPDLASFIYPKPRAGLMEALRRIEVTATSSAIEVLYVQPHASEGDRCVDFLQFADYVRRFDDPLSKRFADHLVLWRNAAGAVEP